MFKRVPGTYLQSLVKIGSATAEILLIWTNVARTNVAWTNVTVTSVQAIFVLVTSVHIRNISAVTDPILTKL